MGRRVGAASSWASDVVTSDKIGGKELYRLEFSLAAQM